MKLRKRALWLGLVALLLADQAFLYTLLADDRLAGRNLIPFDPPLFTDWQRRTLVDIAAIAAGDEALRALSLLDPELGWCPRPEMDRGLYVHDWSGSRLQVDPLARTKAAGVRRIVALGGSFTQGAEVAGAETWSAVLDARHPDIEVANLGVAAYGLDQAYLRFLRDGRGLEPDEVWLGYMPAATLRITTHFMPIVDHWSAVLSFKPMFKLSAEDELELVPSPATDHESTVRLLTDQRAFLGAVGLSDPWVRRHPAAFAVRGSSWTHWFAASRIFVSGWEARERAPRLQLGGSDGEIYGLLRALILACARDVRAAGSRFRLLVLPSQSDLRSARADGRAYWQDLLEDLDSQGIESWDACDALLRVEADREARFWMPQGHYSVAGNRVVAEALEGRL